MNYAEKFCRQNENQNKALLTRLTECWEERECTTEARVTAPCLRIKYQNPKLFDFQIKQTNRKKESKTQKNTLHNILFINDENKICFIFNDMQNTKKIKTVNMCPLQTILKVFTGQFSTVNLLLMMFIYF